MITTHDSNAIVEAQCMESDSTEVLSNHVSVDATPTNGLAVAVVAPTPARATLEEVNVQQGDRCREMVLRCSGGITITYETEDADFAHLLGWSTEHVVDHLDLAVARAQSLCTREIPLTTTPAGWPTIDTRQFFAELGPEATPQQARAGMPCACGRWVARGQVVKIHEALKRVLACQACTPALTKKDVERPSKEKIAGASRRLSYAGVPLADTTDTHDAARFATTCGEDVRFIVDSSVADKPWLIWSGRTWERDAVRPVRRRLMLFWKATYEVAKSNADRSVLEVEAAAWSEFASHAKRRLNRVGLDSVLSVLPSFEGISTSEAALDGPDTAMLLNVTNGTIELVDGSLREHRRADMMTRLIDLEYAPSAEAPRWVRFLGEVFEDDADLVDFVHRFFGYVITGLTKEEKFVLLFQPGGGGGKGTLVNTVYDLLGPYAKNVEPSSLADDCKETIRSDLKRLQGARFMVVNELEEGTALAESLVKKIASGDLITARNRYADESEYRSTVKGVMPTNHLPRVKSEDGAIWDRLLVVPFRRKFRGTEGQDKDLGKKLRAELPGILAWAVRGCLAWQAEGLDPPVAVQDATKDLRERQNTFDLWLDACTEREPGAWAATEALHEDHETWCARKQMQPCAKAEFGRRLARVAGLEDQRGVIERRQVRGWRGIRLRTPEERRVKLADL